MCCNLKIIIFLWSVSVVAICMIRPLFVAAAGGRQSHSTILINYKHFATQNTTWLTHRLVIIEVISLFLFFLYFYSVWFWDSLFSWILSLECCHMNQYIKLRPQLLPRRVAILAFLKPNCRNLAFIEGSWLMNFWFGF